MSKIFIDNGLALRKCSQKKNWSYFKMTQELSKPYFCKLDDRGYDFTAERLVNLQKATQNLKVDLLKLDVTLDCEGCFFFPDLANIANSKLAKSL